MSATDFGDPHQIIHIPPRDLTGSREVKLAELDLFLTQLLVVRLALCGHAVRLEGFNGASGRQQGQPRSGWRGPVRRLRGLVHALAKRGR